MKKYLALLSMVIAGCILIGCSQLRQKELSVVLDLVEDVKQYQQWNKQAGEVIPVKDQVAGAILPHHLIVGHEHARFFKSIAQQKPEVIVIIGPNHYERGSEAILSSDIPYYTPYGLLEIDKQIQKKLLQSPLIKKNSKPFYSEHSISSLVGFIKQTFPETKIVPLITKLATNRDDCDRLVQLLNKTLPENSLVIGSVDFSHTLPKYVADFHDKTSLATIKNFDFDFIFDLEIDSPASLYTTLGFLKARGQQQLVYEEHTNSDDFVGGPPGTETTSHFFLAFAEGKKPIKKYFSALFFGDAMFSRGVSHTIKKIGIDNFLKPLAHGEDRFFRGNHFNVLNLEGPISTMPAIGEKPVHLINSPDIALPLLKQGRFNMISTANNHIFDAGETGIKQTKIVLKENNISSFGNPTPCIEKKVYTTSASFCAFDDSNRNLNKQEALEIIKTISSDYIIVSVHWGYEMILAENKHQIELAHALIDNGADIIIGHHPHVIQPMEWYRNKPIFYSLGNFIFDMDHPSTHTGLALGLFFEENTVHLSYFPFRSIENQPKLLHYDERKKFLDIFEKEKN